MKHRAALLIVVVGLSGLGGCAGLSTTPLTLPGRYSLVREQLEIHSDFPLAAQHRLIEELTALRFDLSRRLGLPLSDEPVEVYLFESAERFNGFMRLNHPDFPQRRALFVETDTRLTVYAHWGDRVAEDLRHEVAHGYLHAMAPHLPLWLDEALAEYSEVPRGYHGFNLPHLHLLQGRLRPSSRPAVEGSAGSETRAELWRPDLRRLEQFHSAFDMNQEDYAEAWAWAHFLLQSRPEHAELLHRYLEDLRRDGAAEPLSARLARLLGSPEVAVIDHVRHLSAAKP